MPRLRQVAKDEATAPIVTTMYDWLFEGRDPVAESAPILQNFTNVAAPMLRSIPPVTTASKSCAINPSTAAIMAAIAEAQAASQTKFGPWKL